MRSSSASRRPGQRPQALLEPLDVRRRGDVERAHGGALGAHRALARTERARERRVEDRVLDQGLGEFAHGFLAPGANSAALVVCVAHAFSVVEPA